MTSPAPRPNLVGPAVSLGLGAAVCLSTQDMFIKLLVADLNVFQIIFVRSVFIVIAALFWVRYINDGWRSLIAARPGLMSFRIICNIVAWFCYYVSLAYLPLTVYTCIGFSVFIFTALLSGPLLKENLRRRDWIAAIAGMVGVLLVVNPTDADAAMNLPAVILLLFGAFVWALSLIATRALGATMSSGGIMFYTGAGLLLVGGVGAPFVWQPPTSEHWLLLLGIGVLSFLGQSMSVSAYRLARVAVIIPTQYTMLLWATLFSWLVWNELPSGQLLTGGALIIGGGLLVALPLRSRS